MCASQGPGCCIALRCVAFRLSTPFRHDKRRRQETASCDRTHGKKHLVEILTDYHNICTDGPHCHRRYSPSRCRGFSPPQTDSEAFRRAVCCCHTASGAASSSRVLFPVPIADSKYDGGFFNNKNSTLPNENCAPAFGGSRKIRYWNRWRC